MNTKKLLENFQNGDGATLKKGKLIVNKTGYQVGLEGKQTKDINEAMKFIDEYEGNCGLWFEDGIYYIDKSKRFKTKKQALQVGREHNQISIYDWKNDKLIYC